MADGRAGCGGDEVVEVGSNGAGVIVGGPWPLRREDAWKGNGAGDGWRVGRLRCKVNQGTISEMTVSASMRHNELPSEIERSDFCSHFKPTRKIIL